MTGARRPCYTALMFKEVFFGVLEGIFYGTLVGAAIWAAAIALGAILVGIIFLIA